MKHSLGLVMVIAFLVGCGGDDSNGAGSGGSNTAGSGGSNSCEKVSACGGTLVGDWKITEICVEQPGASDDIKEICDVAKLEINSTTATGSISYKADLTFTQTTTLDSTGTLILPASCLKQGSKTYTCSQLQEIFRGDPGAAQIACTSADGGCKCNNPVHETITNTGTYMASGSTVMLSTSKEMGTAEYCVKGSKLYLHTTMSASTAAGGNFSPQGQLVLEKQ